jgi:ATP-dependent Clp protease ATP-binding subunit ClpA
MEDLGKRLCDLIQHAVDAAEPEASLRAVAALREDLETFEEAQVARWLRRGASFTVVAEALGISRQAAHRRYRHLADAEPEAKDQPEDAPAREGRILITSEARAVVKLARQEASALGARAVGTEHLLLGILRFGDVVGAGALEEAGIDLGAARSNAQITLVDGSLDGVPEGPGGISPQARAAFEQSLHEAVSRGDGYIGVEHLLIATVRHEDGGAHRTLQALGVDPDDLLEQLQRSRVT